MKLMSCECDFCLRLMIAYTKYKICVNQLSFIPHTKGFGADCCSSDSVHLKPLLKI